MGSKSEPKTNSQQENSSLTIGENDGTALIGDGNDYQYQDIVQDIYTSTSNETWSDSSDSSVTDNSVYDWADNSDSSVTDNSQYEVNDTFTDNSDSSVTDASTWTDNSDSSVTDNSQYEVNDTFTDNSDSSVTDNSQYAVHDTFTDNSDSSVTDASTWTDNSNNSVNDYSDNSITETNNINYLDGGAIAVASGIADSSLLLASDALQSNQFVVDRAFTSVDNSLDKAINLAESQHALNTSLLGDYSDNLLVATNAANDNISTVALAAMQSGTEAMMSTERATDTALQIAANVTRSDDSDISKDLIKFGTLSLAAVGVALAFRK